MRHMMFDACWAMYDLRCVVCDAHFVLGCVVRAVRGALWCGAVGTCITVGFDVIVVTFVTNGARVIDVAVLLLILILVCVRLLGLLLLLLLSVLLVVLLQLLPLLLLFYC